MKPTPKLLLLLLVLSTACLPDLGNKDDTGQDTTEADTDGETDPYCKSGEVSYHQGIPMALICPGTFTMGSPGDEVGRDEWETEHEVTLTRGYYLGVHEVTQDEFAALMGYQPSAHPGCGTCAVENTNWHAAAGFANAVSTTAGLPNCYDCQDDDQDGRPDGCTLSSAHSTPYDCEGYRIPTEAEWEFAARAGDGGAFSNGGNLLAGTEDSCDVVVLDDGSQLGDIALFCGNSEGQPDEVGSREPNVWGLYDMHGNVWEWCHDKWDTSDYFGDATDPVGGTGTYQVRRGGSWYQPPSDLRSGRRGACGAGYVNGDQGFRLAITK